jgi:hypothetical protein
MFGSLMKGLANAVFSERERSEGLIRALYKRDAGADLDEDFARYEVPPAEVIQLFDRLHDRFGHGILSKDRAANQSAMHGAILDLMRTMDAFVEAKHARHDRRRA